MALINFDTWCDQVFDTELIPSNLMESYYRAVNGKQFGIVNDIIKSIFDENSFITEQVYLNLIQNHPDVYGILVDAFSYSYETTELDELDEKVMYLRKNDTSSFIKLVNHNKTNIISSFSYKGVNEKLLFIDKTIDQVLSFKAPTVKRAMYYTVFIEFLKEIVPHIPDDSQIKLRAVSFLGFVADNNIDPFVKFDNQYDVISLKRQQIFHPNNINITDEVSFNTFCNNLDNLGLPLLADLLRT